jgi:hypothetical protein
MIVFAITCRTHIYYSVIVNYIWTKEVNKLFDESSFNQIKDNTIVYKYNILQNFSFGLILIKTIINVPYFFTGGIKATIYEFNKL